MIFKRQVKKAMVTLKMKTKTMLTLKIFMIMMKVMMVMMRKMMTCSRGKYSSSSTGGSSGPGLQRGKCNVEIIIMITKITMVMAMMGLMMTTIFGLK